MKIIKQQPSSVNCRKNWMNKYNISDLKNIKICGFATGLLQAAWNKDSHAQFEVGKAYYFGNEEVETNKNLAVMAPRHCCFCFCAKSMFGALLVQA